MKNLLFLSIIVLLGSCTHKDLDRNISSNSMNISFPSNAHKTKEVFIFGNPNTSSTAIELTNILDEINKNKLLEDQVKLRYFVELPVDGNEEGVGVVGAPSKQIVDLGLENLNLTYSAKELPHSTKHIIFNLGEPDSYGWMPSLWMQDYGQFYMANEKITFLDLSYSNLSNTSEIHRYIRSPKGLMGQVDNDFKGKRESSTINTTLEGGDIESLPNGTVLVGADIHPELESYFLHNLGQNLLKVPSHFVATGHVDELFTIFPTPKTETSQCGYSLAYIDPMYGLRLALDTKLVKNQPKNRDKYFQAIEYFTGVKGEQALSPSSFSSLSEKFKKDKLISTKIMPWGVNTDYYQWYIFKALEIDLAIKQGLEKIKKELKEDCPNLQAIGLPVLMSDESSGESAFGYIDAEGKTAAEVSDEVKKIPVHLLSSPVNQLVIDEHLIIPTIDGQLSTNNFEGEFLKDYLNVYEWIVPARLEKVGVNPKFIHFIKSNVYVRNGGAIHCGTSSVRSSKRRVY